MADIATDRLSLVVGVTGHRDIAATDEPGLRNAFGRILEELARQCPHTPLLVLSGLAAGADSLAAEEAMSRGISVMACLPMPVAEYERDFSPPELARFRSLLAASARVVVTSTKREHGYLATGRFIALYSHLLVAFWDGDGSRGAGGTADVIHMRETGRSRAHDVEEIPYFPDVGPVDVVATPRASGPRPARPYAVERLPRDETALRNFDAVLSRIDVYNADLMQVPAAAGEPQLQNIMERTDAVANRLQRQTAAFQLFLFVIAFLAAAAQVITHVPPFAKVIGLLAAFVAYRIARSHQYENRYQDYRAVAEGLRVQSAWYCAGLRHKLVDAAYLRMQEGELQWIRLTLRSFYLVCCEGLERSDASYERPVCQHWVESQWQYYGRSARREHAMKRRLDVTAIVALALGIACSIGAASALGHFLPCALYAPLCKGNPRPPNFDVLANLLTVPLVLAAMLGAIFTHYAEKQNLVGNARRYERMQHVFERARQDLVSAAGKPRDSQQIIYELGRAALVEHADWLIMRRDRPMEVVMV